MAESKRERLGQLHSTLKAERDSSWLPHWRSLSEYILPRRSRFLVTEHNKGTRRNEKIIDPTATLAARTQRAGMFTGITSPARPWFNLGTPDPDLMEVAAVKEWLHVVTERMRSVMLRSNLYNALPLAFGDVGTFGTAAFIVLEDARNVFRCYPMPIGSYTLSQDDTLRVDTMTREYTMTVRQMVAAYGNNVSPTVKSLYASKKLESPVQVTHVIGPNLWANEGQKGSKDMPVHSCYYESSGDNQSFLRESGFQSFPVMAPRWEVTGEDVYASECPGMVCLGDVQALQYLHKTKAQANQKNLSPPLVAPASMRNVKISQIPGDVTFVPTGGQDTVKSLYDVKFDIQGTLLDIEDHQTRISQAYYEDLFLMLARSDRREITAREIEERHEEKLLMLGPTLEQLNSGLLDPLIDRVFEIMSNQGMFPPPPEELSGTDIRVEYISIMAQAQKLLSASSIERFTGYVSNLAAVQPDVLDKVDFDQTVDEYGSIVGVPPRLIRSDDATAQIRADRQEQQAAVQQAALDEQNAKNANVLSKTDMGGDNALTQILNAGAAG